MWLLGRSCACPFEAGKKSYVRQSFDGARAPVRQKGDVDEAEQRLAIAMRKMKASVENSPDDDNSKVCVFL